MSAIQATYERRPLLTLGTIVSFAIITTLSMMECLMVAPRWGNDARGLSCQLDGDVAVSYTQPCAPEEGPLDYLSSETADPVQARAELGKYLDDTLEWRIPPRKTFLKIPGLAVVSFPRIRLPGHRYVRDGKVWQARFSFWLVATPCLIIPLVYGSAVFRSAREIRRKGEGRCEDCGYDLRGGHERCPECGRATA